MKALFVMVKTRQNQEKTEWLCCDYAQLFFFQRGEIKVFRFTDLKCVASIQRIYFLEMKTALNVLMRPEWNDHGWMNSTTHVQLYCYLCNPLLINPIQQIIKHVKVAADIPTCHSWQHINVCFVLTDCDHKPNLMLSVITVPRGQSITLKNKQHFWVKCSEQGLWSQRMPENLSSTSHTVSLCHILSSIKHWSAVLSHDVSVKTFSTQCVHF